MRDMRPRMLDILLFEDIPGFRAVTGADPKVTDDEILEAIHRARIEHKGVNNLRTKESKRWLNGRL